VHIPTKVRRAFENLAEALMRGLHSPATRHVANCPEDALHFAAVIPDEAYAIFDIGVRAVDLRIRYSVVTSV
jgi:hypothetical protein